MVNYSDLLEVPMKLRSLIQNVLLQLACFAGKHDEPEIAVSAEKMIWRCPRCHKTISLSVAVQEAEYRAKIADAQDEFYTCFGTMVDNDDIQPERADRMFKILQDILASSMKEYLRKREIYSKPTTLDLLKAQYVGLQCSIKVMEALHQLPR